MWLDRRVRHPHGGRAQAGDRGRLLAGCRPRRGMPQTGALLTKEAVELTRHAEACGAAAVLALPPYYPPLSADGYRAYYSAVAEATKLPLGAYNIPFLTGKDFDVEALEALAQEIPSLRYVKESSGNVTQMQVVARELRGQVTVLMASIT